MDRHCENANFSGNEHLDAFSGIGGWGIAAREVGFKTVAFCESDPRCREFLKATYGVTVEPDIRTLDGTKYQGITLFTASPPCQPASRAGKQGGESDDRWLWPEALRVLAQAKPTWCVFENPPGIGDVGLDGILSEMERLSYEVRTFDLPACAVDSPQLRHRLWIVGHTNSGRPLQPQRSEREQRGRTGHSDEGDMAHSGHDADGYERREQLQKCDSGIREPSEIDLADTERQRRERRPMQSGEPQGPLSPACGLSSAWAEAEWIECGDRKFRRAPRSLIELDHGLQPGISLPLAETHRSILGAIGNSIVPQVAIEILKAITQVENSK